MESGQYGEAGAFPQSLGSIIVESMDIINNPNTEINNIITPNSIKRPADKNFSPPGNLVAKTSKLTSQTSLHNSLNQLDNQGKLTSDSLITDSVTKDNNTNSNPVMSNKSDTRSAYESNKLHRYNHRDKGPYYLLIESSAEGENIGRLHKMSIGKLIFSRFQSESMNILNISSSGRNRIKLECSNYKSVNAILDSPLMEQNGLRGYIPETVLFRKGVIRQVDTKLSEEEILSVINSSIKVTSIRRMTRNLNTENNTPARRINTQTVVLTFRGQYLPDFVSIYGAKCNVLPYIYRITQCLNCLRFGHISAQCKGSTRCSRCTGNHSSSNCNADQMLCVSCKGNHLATDRTCPEYTNQYSIKKYMAHNNVGFAEAKVKHKNYSEVVSSPPKNLNEFPPLNTYNRYQVLENISNEIENTISENDNRSLPSSSFHRPRVTFKPEMRKQNFRKDSHPSDNVFSHKKVTQEGIHNPYPPQPHLINSISHTPHVDISEGLLSSFCEAIKLIIKDVIAGKDTSSLKIREIVTELLSSNQTHNE